LIALSVMVFSLSGCNESNNDDSEKIEASGLEPSPNNQVLRLFQKPFKGNYANSWPFDHDLPFGKFNSNASTTEGSSDVLTWRGETIKMSWGDGKFHNGYDWSLPDGTPLFAVAEGEVVYAQREPPFKCGSKGMVAALIVMIRHKTSNSEIIDSQYAHLSRIDVADGQLVSAGEQIGLSGDSGCAYGAHLHFSVFAITPDGERVVVDPFGWEGESQDPWEKYTAGVVSKWLWKKGQAPRADYSF
jgi:murein DD-endopeptidase MepM/ murein hydrolase activator NlpD